MVDTRTTIITTNRRKGQTDFSRTKYEGTRRQIEFNQCSFNELSRMSQSNQRSHHQNNKTKLWREISEGRHFKMQNTFHLNESNEEDWEKDLEKEQYFFELAEEERRREELHQLCPYRPHYCWGCDQYVFDHYSSNCPEKQTVIYQYDLEQQEIYSDWTDWY